MNLLDIIIWYIVFFILMTAIFIWIGNNISDWYNLTSETKVNELQQLFSNKLRENIDGIVVDKQKENFQSEIKTAFLNTLKWKWFNIDPSNQDNGDYWCYNVWIENEKIHLWNKIENLSINIANIDESLKQTDYSWKIWNEFLNVICFYNTYNFLKSSKSIDFNDSPIAYIQYVFYEDNQYITRNFSKKWILYFN